MSPVAWSCRAVVACACLLAPTGQAGAQTELPDVHVIARKKEEPRAARRPAAGAPAPAAARAVSLTDAGATPITRALDATRERLTPRAGATAYTRSAAEIEAMPQGANKPLSKALLQAPGVAQDSAVNGAIHVRNEHGKVQYRINGILLPDGVSGFGQVFDTSFVRSLSLVTGALPAQYGLRTSGVVDILSKAGATTPEGSVSVYGGSGGLATTSFDYGGSTRDGWDYFAAGRLRGSAIGLESPIPDRTAIHDRTRQGSYFFYASKAIDEQTRFTLMSGGSVNKHQIPNSPLQQPQFTAFGLTLFDSARLNENQIEHGVFNLAAVQKSFGDVDAQLAVHSRYARLHFVPDLVGDLMFNGVASDVRRASLLNGMQGDVAWRIAPSHTLRTGFMANVEKTSVSNASLLFPLDAAGDPVDAAYPVVDRSAKVGWTLSGYVQDEWKIDDRLTLNAGLRFDRMKQYSTAGQLSPRASLVYKPLDGTTLHAGYARFFTPPPQVEAAPASLPLVLNTTQQPEILVNAPVRPERADVFDIGVDQRLAPGLDVGVDVYFKRTRNVLDNGQFGAALALASFNYDRGYNTGVEFKARYEDGPLRFYGNLAWGRQRARLPSSNQSLLGADEFAYMASNYVYTDHAQTWSGSAGVSYLWNRTRFSADMIFGSGMRAGFANTDHLPSYTQVNAGVSHEIQTPSGKPLTLRFDVVNLFDAIYQIRDGSGIGVFAPQYGPRRGFYAGLTQKF